MEEKPPILHANSEAAREDISIKKIVGYFQVPSLTPENAFPAPAGRLFSRTRFLPRNRLNRDLLDYSILRSAAAELRRADRIFMILFLFGLNF